MKFSASRLSISSPHSRTGARVFFDFRQVSTTVTHFALTGTPRRFRAGGDTLLAVALTPLRRPWSAAAATRTATAITFSAMSRDLSAKSPHRRIRSVRTPDHVRQRRCATHRLPDRPRVSKDATAAAATRT
ncbi:hypothetical protein GCM10027612_34680 [Microbispora bryophytorum subsp. camponoti]